MIPREQIEKSHHILIKSVKDTLPQASVLYSYCLTQHKKVSWMSEGFDTKLSFLPWYEKARSQENKSADLVLDAAIDILELYEFLIQNEIKINQKMATALYAGFLKQYKNFTSSASNGTVFAAVSELLNLGAEHQLCITSMFQNNGLHIVRLKALLYKKVSLIENACVASVSISDEELSATGASREDLDEVASELLSIAHVQEVRIKGTSKNPSISQREEKKMRL